MIQIRRVQQVMQQQLVIDFSTSTSNSNLLILYSIKAKQPLKPRPRDLNDNFKWVYFIIKINIIFQK